MATTKKRINISLSKDLDETLVKIAKRDHMPQATKAEHLLRVALELEEDDALNALASRRDRRNARFEPSASAWS